MNLNVRFAVAVVWLLCRTLLRWRVSGTQKVPAEGALLLVANHVHLADPVLLVLAFPRRVSFMAKEELFRYPYLGRLLRDAGMMPVARAGELQQKRDVMRQAEDLLRQGRVVALFPEGKRSRTGILLQGKPGAAMLAIHTGAPLIPVAVQGTEQIRGKWWWLRRPKITITIGDPFLLDSHEGRIGRSESTRLTTDIMQRIAAMLSPERRGHYAG